MGEGFAEALGVGSLPGLVAALLGVAALVSGALWVDRRADGWVAGWRRSPVGFLRLVAARPELARLGLWLGTSLAAVSLAAVLSPALVGLGALGLTLAGGLAAAGPARDVLFGVANALNGRVERGALVEVDGVRGEVVRVGLRTLTVRSLDGTLVELPHGRAAGGELRRVLTEDGGYPVSLRLEAPQGTDARAALEAAREAAVLAPHAHLGSRPRVTLHGTAAVVVEVEAVAASPEAESDFRSEVALAFREALRPPTDADS